MLIAHLALCLRIKVNLANTFFNKILAMKRLFTFLLTLLSILLASDLSGQSLRISRYIIATDTVMDGGDFRAISTDDAEQENEAIDALDDDDIDFGWEGEPQDQNILTCGLRFQRLGIPKGARIDSAYIIVNSHESKTTDDIANITIVGDATDDAETFTLDQLIDSRPRTNAEVRWIIDEEWGLWTYHRTPDLSGIIQELVNRDGWEAGKSIAFIMLGEDQGPSEVENAREFESFENIADPEDGGDGQNHPERVPELIVYYTVESAELSIPIIATGIIDDGGDTRAISSDDAEQENDEIEALDDDDIDFGWEGEPQDQNILTCGLRFQNVFIPNGAVIDSAFIEVNSHESKSEEDVANITIVGDATDDAETFTLDQLIDARPRTDAEVRWIIDEEWGLWTYHRTPDIKDIVQEIVDRDGWESGNSIAFVFLGEDQGPSEVENAREFESFENIADPEDGGDGQNHPERVPRLFVYFSSPNGTTSVDDIFMSDVKSLRAFPNPAEDFINIQLESDESAFIKIYDMQGRQWLNMSSSFGNQLQLNASRYPRGMYIITAEQSGSKYAQKVILR
jgi:hypothetical protein